jgi:hypothetical protein
MPRGGNLGGSAGRKPETRVSGTLVAAVAYLPWLAARLFPLDWRWPGGISLN